MNEDNMTKTMTIETRHLNYAGTLSNLHWAVVATYDELPRMSPMPTATYENANENANERWRAQPMAFTLPSTTKVWP